MTPDSKRCTCGNGEAEEDRTAVLGCPVHAPLGSAGILRREDGAAWSPWMVLDLDDA